MSAVLTEPYRIYRTIVMLVNGIFALAEVVFDILHPSRYKILWKRSTRGKSGINSLLTYFSLTFYL